MVLRRVADDRGPEAAPATPGRPIGAANALGLQRAAGNAAVAAGIRGGHPLVVQRVNITSDEEAEKALVGLHSSFAGKGSKLIAGWNDNWGDSNCHGFTVHGRRGERVGGTKLLNDLAGYQGTLLIYVSDEKIGHSGRLNGGTLTHLLKGVGILDTPIDPADRMGYDDVYQWPADLQKLLAVIGPRMARMALSKEIRHNMRRADHLATHYRNGENEGKVKFYQKVADRLERLYQDVSDDPATPDDANRTFLEQWDGEPPELRDEMDAEID